MRWWEYLVDKLDIGDTDDLIATLDNFGKRGWELVSVDNGIAYFKRPIEKCPECQGFGKILIAFGGFEICKACGGSGYKE